MNGLAVIQNAKILNIVEKSNDNKENPINWVECVFMKDSDVNTVTINRNVADTLSVDDVYDLLIQITELIKASKDGHTYKQHKFKIVDAYEIN